MSGLIIPPMWTCTTAAVSGVSAAAAVARLEHLDQHLGSIAESDGQALGMMRERSRILLICDALVQHRAYFDAEESE